VEIVERLPQTRRQRRGRTFPMNSSLLHTATNLKCSRTSGNHDMASGWMI
jgi:hypothetical protein